MKPVKIADNCNICIFTFLLYGLLPTTGFAKDSVETNEWLAAHNNYRLLHSVAPLNWSVTLAESAQQFADTCPSGHSQSGYGENIAWATNSRSPQSIVTMWYDEEKDYNYDKPGYISGTGHFTQIVWKNSIEVGCAYATTCSGNWPHMENTWVCQYNPPGNFTNQFAENVAKKNQQIH
jgi:uncharacterized protein YkwD